MNKICTSIEQSLKLIELGIDVNTADMYYPNRVGGHNYPLPIECKMGLPLLSQEIPAWSLSALLRLMPKLYDFEKYPDDGGCQPNLCKGWDNNLWHVVYRLSIYITEWYEDPIDAAFEMVCWLKENKKL